MNLLDHECPSCGANVPFNPNTQKWDCEYCGLSYTLEDFAKYDREMKKKTPSDDKKKKEENYDMDEYLCQNCGAKILTDQNTSATICVYCGSTAIIKSRLQDKFNPEKIIPFAIDKKRVINTFYKFVRKKWFSPKEFSNKENIEKVEGIYIPFWIYDCMSDGKILATARKIRSWRVGDYRYTKTDTYKCVREGNMEFLKVPVDASLKFQDELMDSLEPYDYNGIKDFNISYLSGFLAQKYDVNEDESFFRAKVRIVNSTIDTLKSTIVGFSNIYIDRNEVDIKNIDGEYILMPVWMLNIKYKDKNYTFAMNGQTGKMVGNVPISKIKITLWSIIIWTVLLIISIILALV